MFLSSIKKAIKKTLLTLLKLKWFFFNTVYNILFGKKIITKLSHEGFSSIEEFARDSWTATPFLKRYYKARYNGTACFIKVGNYDGVLEREENIITKINTSNSNLKNRIPSLIKCNLEGKTPYIATSFIENTVEWKTLSEKAISTFLKNIIDCLDELYELSIIHMDLNYGNILANENGDIFILDFGAAFCKDFQNTDSIYSKSILPKKLSLLGGTSKPRCGLYDDAFSILLLIKNIWPEFKIQHKKEWFEINHRIERFQYQFKHFSKSHFEGC